MTARSAQMQAFLANAGWGLAHRAHLAGDASDRRYLRLTMGAQTAVLMDAPTGQGDDPAQFLRIGAHLESIGLSPPRCFAADLDQGFLLLEDLGDHLFARILLQSKPQEVPLYRAASDVLIALQNQPAPDDLPNMAAADWAGAAMLSVTRYSAAVSAHSADSAPLHAALTDALGTYADGPRVLILRDYHAENLLFLPDRTGLAQVGLLDFQLGQMGQPGYDLVSLLQDARRDVSLETEAEILRHFLENSGHADAQFRAAYAVLGAQRALRILGVFVQLCVSDGKPNYLALLPRVYGHLQRNLQHPALTHVARICGALIPAPNSEIIAKIGSQCARSH